MKTAPKQAHALGDTSKRGNSPAERRAKRTAELSNQQAELKREAAERREKRAG